MWKVPEEHRDSSTFFGLNGEPYGAFKCVCPLTGRELVIIASPGGDIGGGRVIPWEHVSVHAISYIIGKPLSVTPNWDEMDYVKGLFWDPEDVVMQLHINNANKVDTHKHTLHLWRPTDKDIPLPDKDLV